MPHNSERLSCFLFIQLLIMLQNRLSAYIFVKNSIGNIAGYDADELRICGCDFGTYH